MMDFSKNDLSKVQEGEPLWNYPKQEWQVVERITKSVFPITFESGASCDYKGVEWSDAKAPTYFWNEIHFEIPERPKRKVKKNLKVIVCHQNGEVAWAGGENFVTESLKSDYICGGYTIEELTKEIEIEE